MAAEVTEPRAAVAQRFGVSERIVHSRLVALGLSSTLAGTVERMGASAEQVLAKFLNKLPTIKVLEGTRIKVLLTNDLTLEAYE